MSAYKGRRTATAAGIQRAITNILKYFHLNGINFKFNAKCLKFALGSCKSKSLSNHSNSLFSPPLLVFYFYCVCFGFFSLTYLISYLISLFISNVLCSANAMRCSSVYMQFNCIQRYGITDYKRLDIISCVAASKLSRQLPAAIYIYPYVCT